MEDRNGLYTTWGREFGIALDGVCECTNQDAYEVLFMAFKRELTQRDFHEMTNTDLLRMRDCANEWFETDKVEATHMRRAIEMLRSHWPREEG